MCQRILERTCRLDPRLVALWPDAVLAARTGVPCGSGFFDDLGIFDSSNDANLSKALWTNRNIDVKNPL
jgi:hypothetical protein